MEWYKDTIEIQTRGKGLYPFTEQVTRRLRQWQVREGMGVLFCVPDAKQMRCIKELLEHSSIETTARYAT